MNNEKENLLPPRRPSTLQDSISYGQILFVIIILLTAVPPGMSTAFSAIALPRLNLNLEETSWFASLPSVGFLLGNLLTSCVIDGYGRKVALFVNTIPAFIGFTFLAVAGSLETVSLYVGQLCTGISHGGVVYAGNVYIAESIAPDNLRFRSTLSTCNSLSICFGVTLTYVLGYFVHYKIIALIAASIALIALILSLVFLPESPAWLDQQGRFKEAQQARYKLGCRHDLSSTGSEINSPGNLDSRLLKFKRKNVYKPLFTMITYFFFRQFSGLQVFVAYLVDAVTVKSVNVDGYLITLICGLLMTLGTTLFVTLLSKLGVRKLAITSSLLSSSATLILGLCIYFSVTYTASSHIMGYIHIFSVCCVVFFNAMGIAVAPYTILGEIFPADIKGVASIPVFSDNFFQFINLMIYPQAVALSSYAIFFMYGIIGLLSVPFVYY